MKLSHRLHRLIGIMVIGIIMLGLSNQAGESDKGYEIVFKAQDKQINPYQEEYEKLLYPTVRITSSSGIGSGVIFNAECGMRSAESIYILTACHVVESQSVVNIKLYNSEIITGTVVITDTIKDLALIKPEINTDSKIKIYTARLATKEYVPYLFSPVWVVGCSLGLNPRPSYGHITNIEKSNQSSSVSICGYEISAPVLPGNSGGPVYDKYTYQVIGIAVWVHTYQGQLITTMAGVVPINEIYKFLESHIGNSVKSSAE